MPIYKTGKSKDGKQGYRVFVYYTDANGNYKSKTNVIYGSAEAKLTEQAILAGVGELTSTVSMTLDELYAQFVETKRTEIRETTLLKTTGILERHVLPHFPNTRIDKLDANKFQKWKNAINEQGLSIVTRQNIYGQFCI